jgi:hypothetical protein
MLVPPGFVTFHTSEDLTIKDIVHKNFDKFEQIYFFNGNNTNKDAIINQRLWSKPLWKLKFPTYRLAIIV